MELRMPVATREGIVFSPYGTDPATGTPHHPHPTQLLVAQWVRRVRAGDIDLAKGIPVLYLQHGVNSGGTRAVLGPILECLFEYPGLRMLIGRKDFQDIRLSILETFNEIMPRPLLLERNEQEHRYTISAPGPPQPQGSVDRPTIPPGGEGSSGIFHPTDSPDSSLQLEVNKGSYMSSSAPGTSTLFFRELKDVRGLGSQEFAIISVHEAHEIEEIAFRTLLQRCRQVGYPNMILMEGNPPGLSHWLNEVCDKDSPKYYPAMTRMILSSAENLSFMSPGYRASLENQPAAYKRRFFLGLTSALPDGTAVYPAFVEAVHVRETGLIPDRPIIRGWDFGLRRAACVWGQRDDYGKVLIHREWMALETPEEQFIEGVITRTNQWYGPRVCLDYGDPAARARDPHGVSTLQRLSDKGINLGYRISTYGERIPLINRKLSEMVVGEPAISISERCPILIEGLAGGYHYPQLKESTSFGPTKDIPARDGYFEHLANAFEYFLVNLFMPGEAAVKRRRMRRRVYLDRLERKQGSAVF